MNPLLQTLRNLGPARLAAMGGVAIALVGFFVYLIARLSAPDLSLLYSDLDLTDSGAIAGKLDEMSVPFAVQAGGSSILVPVDQVDRLRLAMAEEGLPAGGSIGYEIFDQTDGFGTTNFIQSINRVRALEGELARTIGTIDNVRSARVHLVLPERELFSRDRQEPSASVFLKLQRGGLSSEQILAVQHLVAAAVPRLQPQNISIVDDHGNLLARGPSGDAEDLRLMTAEEMRRSYEQKLKSTIEQLLSRSVGHGRVWAQVTVDMDFDRITTSEERYDPDSQVARSSQLVEEKQESSDGAGLDPVSVANNLPEADVPGLLGGAGAATSTANRIEETINYEISRTVQNTVRETGTVRRLSVAVLVDGVYQPSADGVLEYAPRPAEEMAQLEALVRSAVGYDERRGDRIEVANMRFIAAEDEAVSEAPPALFGMPREDWFRLAEMLVLAVVAVLVILLVVRPLLSRVLEGAPAPAADGYDGLLPEPAGGPPRAALAALPGPGANPLATSGALADRAESEIEGLIDINQVEGRVRASSLRKVGEIIEKHPEEAASIIRNWMYQET